MAGESHKLEKVRLVIRASWERSQRLGVDPHCNRLPVVLSAEDIESLQEGADLIAVATPYFEAILQSWPEDRFMMSVSG